MKDKPTKQTALPATGARPGALKGRGAEENPRNRFVPLEYDFVDEDVAQWTDQDISEAERPRTELFEDNTRTILARNESPDVSFDASVNPYRGCEHGCVYCFARPFHEYLGFSLGLDFESKILVKRDAPQLLRTELTKTSWKPKLVGFSGATDAYQPIERRLELTRGCLKVLAEFRNPTVLMTKNFLATRDIDVWQELAANNAGVVFFSTTTLDADLARKLEPRASSPRKRLEAVEAFAKAGVPVGVLTSPVIPGLTDHEIPGLLKAAADAGAQYASFTVLRLPHGVKNLFVSWLQRHFPDRESKVLNRIRELRDGKLSDPRYQERHRGDGIFAQQIAAMFQVSLKKNGLKRGAPKLTTANFRRPGEQMKLL